MLSIEECRKYLGEKSNQMTDEEVSKIRDSLYGLAELALERYFDEKVYAKSKRNNPK